MTPLLRQFLSEARECLQDIGDRLMKLEATPDDAALIAELFRSVHTLKGNSGLFDFPEMTRVLHAGEDLMDAVRSGTVGYSQKIADELLDAMDFVGQLCDQIERGDENLAPRAADGVRLAKVLRGLIGADTALPAGAAPTIRNAAPGPIALTEAARALADVHSARGETLHWIAFSPAEDCFYQGDDPFHTARQTPAAVWGRIVARGDWLTLTDLDAYCCRLDFEILSAAPMAELVEFFRYVPDQVRIVAIVPGSLQLAPHLAPAAGIADAVIDDVLATQRLILALDDGAAWRVGRLKAVAAVLTACAVARPTLPGRAEIAVALDAALVLDDGAPLLAALDRRVQPVAAPIATAAGDFGLRPRAEEGRVAATIKVEQVKIDRLMNLIGEMVVAKNALSFLAQRAEEHFGARELGREIKAQYSVVNRISQEMQDAIMQVSMLPVASVFQRFPRLARDVSRKLGKEVRLVLQGEETEADKNVIESLADPLIHIVRNSLDHGLETADARRACGKPPVGTLTIRAAQEADRVVIEISDDGKGIDPAVIKRKAVEKGVIDQATCDRLDDRAAIDLVFAAGFSTADTVSDLSGRGVGMDVVRTAVEKVKGAITIDSVIGQGTRIHISLPLSMAVTQVMIVESDGQLFGVPMDHVVETVRIPRAALHSVKQNDAAMLRGRIVPLKGLNTLLGLAALPQPNADDELAVLVTSSGDNVVGLVVDEFRESVDVIQKPLRGLLAGLPAYSGSSLMGDGSVLMVLNIKELV